MAGPDLSVFGRRKSLDDYMQLQQAFDLEKRKALSGIQADQEKLASGTVTNDPAALRLANEYLAAKKSGDIERANAIEAFAKTREKNVMLTPDGQYVPLGGMPEALGQLKFGENYGGEQATQQVRSAYEPGRAEDIARRESEVSLETGPEIERRRALAKGSAETILEAGKKGQKAETVLSILDDAEKLLPSATGSLAGTVRDVGKAAIGYSDEKTKANEQLRLYSGWLVSNVPRMEGPQSNFDVQNYKQMAADLGNTMKPIGDRLAALQGLRELQGKYAVDSGIPPIGADELNAPIPAMNDIPSPPNPMTIPGTKEQMDIEFKLRQKGFTPEQISEYMRAKGLK